MALIPERRAAPGSPNVAKCLNDAVEQGSMSREQAERALGHVQRIMGEGASEGQAAARAAEILQGEAAQARRQTALQIMATDRALNDVASHPDGVTAGVAAVLARDIRGKAAYSNVEGRSAALRGLLHAKFAEGLDAYRSTAVGLRRDTIGLTRMVRELYGEATGSAVDANAAAAWGRATDWGADQFRAAGGQLTHNKNWRLPQEWDNARVKAAGRQSFEDFMHGEVAAGRLKIVDWATGEAVDALRRAEIISQAFETIETNGLNKLVPGQRGGAKLANARMERRAFEWATADAWLGFNERFGMGEGGIFDLLVNHLDGMAKDIAMLERLGTNPAATARVLIDTARKGGASEGQVSRLDALWGTLSGETTTPVREWLANTAGSVRAWLSSAQLGSAILSSVADFATLRQTAAWNGLSSTGMMGEYFRLLNPANKADRLLAVRSGLIADGWAKRAMAAQRQTMEEIGQTLPNRVADVVMRVSGLNAHTQAAKWAFGMEFLGRLADDAGRTFSALDPKLRGALERYGLTADQWDRIRTSGLVEQDGVRLIMPEQMTRSGDRADLGAATRLLEIIDAERGFAILEPGALERAITLGQTQAGTFSGEFVRATMQYKSFPVTMMTRHMMRGVESFKAGDHGRYMSALVLGLTAAGAMSVQLKQLAQGKDPRDMGDWRFWGASFFQGGGSGLLGDFLNSSLTRSDRSFYMAAIGGPTAGLVDDIMKLTGANITATVEGKDAHFGREMAQFVRRNTPGTSLWYTRLAFDRLMWDRLQELTDPDYSRSFARMEDRAQREYNQRFWWGPGRTEPDRGPAMGRMFGMDAP